MAHKNFVIRDVVHHISHERDYRPNRAFSSTRRKFFRNFWIFFVIVAMSSGLGYLAVYLPDLIESRRSQASTLMDMGRFAKDPEQLSDSQKQQIMRLLRSVDK
jgi:uncharacterized membrane protein SpoIIM required for sporulation